MSALQQLLAQKIPQWRDEQKRMLAQFGQQNVSDVSLAQLMRGMRGVSAVICDTSYVDPQKGLLIRDLPLTKLMDRSAEELFFLMCAGQLPDAAQLSDLQQDILRRTEVPAYVWRVLDSLPENLHPMTMLSIATLSMRNESAFDRATAGNTAKSDLWQPMLEDALNLIAWLPLIAGKIYQKYLKKQPPMPASKQSDFSDRFADALGFSADDQPFRAFLHRFIIVHCDHEGANASVLTSRVVHSTQSDLYYSLSGAMNCLAGPLHGLANQTSVRFVMEIQREFGGIPTEKALSDWIWQRLNNGLVIPGFGHAVLRDVDPRYQALLDFGEQVCPDDALFRITAMLGEVVPPLLQKQGKAASPYPNIDGISGTLLYHFGMTELDFYTVMFSVAQSIGISAQLILMRALHTPIFRPKSVTTALLQQQFATNSQKR